MVYIQYILSQSLEKIFEGNESDVKRMDTLRMERLLFITHTSFNISAYAGDRKNRNHVNICLHSKHLLMVPHFMSYL